ncbi:methyltransferase domain-containing protein [Streptomyces alfalfae]|uniref:SAM-dependent methyltransferase n=1 Tax=Streptomyces alfalfae TaxID=1642299 RepID=A0ABN4VBS2_9ACTN|nr:class I SAM-dependent methyltransferase [Streptomyces alfalfae]AYA15061.1 methyltransferase domain-containing protein [Streptomyces fradiae]APY84751.1 SAM-dependent methyltransferase [Streptomyces alfalfae]QUI35438.1 class I SAM-dependent methyltransferase [Streptomyces alfalfae]RXX47182.1 methyltransferase domain-containing protein [Streptomyces alfalfae]RZM86001.1 methyltransferase domain-containing protein [Streptomyces alfalfae]
MAGQLAVDEPLLDYVRQMSLRDDDVLRELRAETAGMPMLQAMLVLPEEAQLLALLVRVTGARRVLEVGTFTGYSSLCMARALPPGGKVVTCDISERWTAVARRYWERAGVADLIDLRLGDAAETLDDLDARHGPGSFDLAFLDADKAHYVRYYEQALALVRPGGLLVLDNTLFFGKVVDPAAQDPDTLAIRELNALLRDDERVDISMLAVADGLTLVHKKP